MSEPAPVLTLDSLEIGQRAKVLSLDLAPVQRQHILEMGLTKGVQIEIIRFAPLGDPIDLKVRGYHLSIRKEDARGIQVQLI